jgi:hypothetical protein
MHDATLAHVVLQTVGPARLLACGRVIGWVIVKSGPGRTDGWAFQRPDPLIMASPGTSVAPEGWTGVAKAVMPAVVNIATSKTT